MNDQLLRLCKRLNKFTLDEIKAIADDTDDAVLKLLLMNFVQEKKLIKQGDIYFYNKSSQNQNLSRLPQFFQHHSKKDIDYIIKGFCSDVEVFKMIDLFGFSKFVMNKFNQYFRTLIYEKQKEALLKHFEKTPKTAQERSYMNTKVYLYLYQGNLYVSEKLLKSPNLQKHTEAERLEIKNIYLRSYRKVLSRSFAHKFHLHLSEEIWKWGKGFKKQYHEFNKILFS